MSAKTRSKKKFKKTLPIGAATFAIGLYLAGPQVAVAVADSADHSSPGSSARVGGPRSSATDVAATASGGSLKGASLSAVVDRGVETGRPLRVATGLPLPAAADRAALAGRDFWVSVQSTVQGGDNSAARIAARGGREGSKAGSLPSAATGAAARAAIEHGTSSAALDYVAGMELSATSVTDAGDGGVTTTATLRGSLAKQFASFKAAPMSMRAPVASLPEVLTGVDAQINAVAVRVFSGLLNLVSTLPVNPVTDLLQGGMLLIRKSLFNQSATINAVQTANNAQLVTGSIDVIDPEGDGWTIQVVGDPTHGTVVLSDSEQAKGIGATDYTYTPGEGYSGSDSFVVKVSPTADVHNILDPFGLLTSRYYTVAVGDAAASGNACASCLPKDVLDTTLFLNDAGVAVTVEKQGVLVPRYFATVTLSAFAANQAFSWMDTRGRTGSVSVDQMLVQDWSGLEQKAAQNGTKALLAFSYSDQGLDKAIFVDVDDVTKNADGTYQFSGQLMDDVPAQDGRIDAWDFLGIDYKTAYENYLDGSGLTDCKSGQTCSTVTSLGILAATTLSPSAYIAVGGHDYPLPAAGEASATQLYPGSPGPAGAPANRSLDTMLPWGTDGSFIFGSSTGVIKLFTANAPTGSTPSWEAQELKGFGWQSGAYALAAYNQTVVNANGTPIPVSITGTAPGGKVLTLSLADAVNPGSLIGETITGEGIAPGTVIDGFVAKNADGTVTYTLNNAVATAQSITIATPNIYQKQPGLVVGLANGAVEYWNGGGCTSTPSGCAPDVPAWDGWTELAPVGSKTGWTGLAGELNTLTALPNNQGLVVGTSNGGIYLWDSAILASDGTIVPGPSAGAGCSNSSPGNCWKELRSPNPVPVNGINVVIPFGQNGGFVAGTNAGELLRWDGAEFTQLQAATGNAVTTITPYDQTTFVGGISGTPVVSNNGIIAAPSYASSVLDRSPVLAASASGCDSSYSSGSGAGCGGYVLTVQSIGNGGNVLLPGQVLYGAAGLAAGTTIIAQISDASGRLCATFCFGGRGGIYLVDNSQLVAPGTPMSASDGSGFIAGFQDGSVSMFPPGSAPKPLQLQGSGWGSSVKTAIGWRDGVAVGLANGATFYWSPSNNPDNNNPNNPRALVYPGATVPSLAKQASGWSELQGRGWENSALSMTLIGDGFAVGLSTTSSKKNGAVEMFTGFGSDLSSTSAFGYRPGVNGPEAMTAVNKFTEIASQRALSGNAANGNVAQLVPVTTFMTDDVGNVVQRQSLVAGLANAGIYSWTGSNTDVNQGLWSTLQNPGAGGSPTLYQTQLEAAWAYGSKLDPNAAWGAPGGVGDPYVPANGTNPASGDPVFGLQGNSAWCGTKCASYGDYSPLVFSEDYGSLKKLGTTVTVDFDLSSVIYGYAFYPNSIISKFLPGKYSVGMLVALKGGPSLNLYFPTGGSTQQTEDVVSPTVSFGSYLPTAVGTFSTDVGFVLGIDAQLGVNQPVDKLQLAHAYYAPGFLYTWNAESYRKNMSFSSSSFSDAGYLSPTAAEAVLNSDEPISVIPRVTPYMQASYGLFTPKTTPLIGKWSIFDMGAGYQNPISFTLTAPANNLKDLKMSVTSQGFINAGVHFLPNLTSSLSWDSKLQVYSVTNQTQPQGTLDV